MRRDIVGVYAERLSAVTHAFALCCHTLQEGSGRLGSKYSVDLFHICVLRNIEICKDLHSFPRLCLGQYRNLHSFPSFFPTVSAQGFYQGSQSSSTSMKLY